MKKQSRLRPADGETNVNNVDEIGASQNNSKSSYTALSLFRRFYGQFGRAILPSSTDISPIAAASAASTAGAATTVSVKASNHAPVKEGISRTPHVGMDINISALEQMRLADMRVEQMKLVLSRCVDKMKMPVDSMETQLNYIRAQLNALSCLPTSSKHGAPEVGEEDGMMLSIDDYEVLLGRIDILKAHAAVHKMMANRSGHFLSSSVDYSPQSNHVHLKTVLVQQMKCIKLLYGSVNVDLDIVMLPKCINGFVTTDRLWLAENVLSLLSNAAENATHAATIWALPNKAKESIRIRCLLVNTATLEAVPPTLTSLGDSSVRYNVRIEVDDDYIHVPETFQNEIFNGPDAILTSILSSHHEQSIDFAIMALLAIRGRCNMLGGRCGVNDIISRTTRGVPTGHAPSGQDIDPVERGVDRNHKALGSCFWFEIPYDDGRYSRSVSGSSTSWYSNSGQPKRPRKASRDRGEMANRQTRRFSSFSGPRERKDSECSSVTDAGQSYSLLIIDTNALFLSKIANVLETKRMRVTTALLGLHALKMVARWGTRTEEDYDAVLIGLGPPDHNRKQKLVMSKARERTAELLIQRVGPSTDSWNEANANGLNINLRRLDSKHGGAVARNQYIPIVGMIDDDRQGSTTGLTDDAVTKDALMLGVDAVMRKSFKTEYLCGVLATVFQQAFRTKLLGHPDNQNGSRARTTPCISREPTLHPFSSRPGSVDIMKSLDEGSHRSSGCSGISNDHMASFVRTLLLQLSNAQLIEAVASSPTNMIPTIIHHLPRERELDEPTFIAIVKRCDPSSLIAIASALPAPRIPAILPLIPESSVRQVISKLPASTIIELVPLLPYDRLEVVVPYVPNAETMMLIAGRLLPETLIALSEDLPQDYLVAIIASQDSSPTNEVKARILASLPPERLGSLTSLILALGPPSHDVLLSVICSIEDANIVCHLAPLLPDPLVETLIHKLPPQTLMLVMPRLKPHLVTMAYAVMRFG